MKNCYIDSPIYQDKAMRRFPKRFIDFVRLCTVHELRNLVRNKPFATMSVFMLDNVSHGFIRQILLGYLGRSIHCGKT